MAGFFGGSDDPCILGLNNGTYPNGTLGKGDWEPFGIYMPTDEEVDACQNANDPWTGSGYYGWWTTYLILATLAVVSITNGIRRFHSLNRIHGLESPASFHSKISALFRWASYPQTRAFGGAIPPLGPLVLIFGLLVFSLAVCFLRRPYYRPPNFGSPPIALRSEWIATALVPWIYATATKRNFIVFFSGVSYHRVLTLHKWIPWTCLFMSIVHTVAMIVAANRVQPWWYSLKSDACYWNGFPALASLAWLCIMSLGPVRNRFYETFYVLHIAAATTFFVWMYIHLANMLNSWQYMHATAVLWGAGIAWRALVYAFDHGWFTRIPQASIEALPSDAIRISVSMRSNRTWSAGSHVYLRFLSIRPWESHPFTISSLPVPINRKESEALDQSAGNEMMFLVRPRGGITARLNSSLKASGGQILRACLIDGPYEGFMDNLRACDSVLLLAGGSGMSAIIPVAQALMRAGGSLGMSCCRHVEVIWAIRDVGATEWFKEQLDEIRSAVSIHITGAVDSKTGSSIEKLKDKGEEGVEMSIRAKDYSDRAVAGRPDFHCVLEKTSQKLSGRLGVLVCGPESMVMDARDAVASLQRSILVSDTRLKCTEVELYEESYSF